MDMQPVTELARAVVAQVAPGELPLFAAVSRAYVDDPGRARKRRGSDEALAFGLVDAASFLTPVTLGAAGAVARYLLDDLGKSLTHMASDAIAKRVASLFSREPGTPPLTETQLSRIRTITIEVARDGGVAEPRASLLADALVNHLISVTPTTHEDG